MNAATAAKRVWGALRRVFPRCGMISQAVAFNMFLAFFPMLLVVLGILSSYVNTRAALPDVVEGLYAVLPPGSRQMMTAFLLPRAAHPWHWALLGCGGTILAGTQVMKLLMEGIQVIHADQDKHSFLGRQFRGFLLLLVTLAPFLLVVLLTVFGLPLRKWTMREFGRSGQVSGFWGVMFPVIAMLVAILVLAVIYSVAHPVTRGWREVLPGAAAATLAWWAVNSLFGIYVRRMQYGQVYGGLAAAIGLMVWMELSAVIVFLGAAWNAEAAASELGKNSEGEMPAGRPSTRPQDKPVLRNMREIHVECYSGHRADERPVRFVLAGRTFEVREVEDRWFSPGATFFRVIAEDGDRYVLRHDEAQDVWTWEAFRAAREGRGSGAP